MKFRHGWIVAIAVAASIAGVTQAQEIPSPDHAEEAADQQQGCMAGMRMPGCRGTKTQVMQHGSDSMSMQPGNFVQSMLSHTGSGTSAEPISTPVPMLMTMKGSWMLMFHANLFVLDEQQ